MAVTETAQPEKMLNRTMASLAGGVSIALLAATISATVVYMALHAGAATWLWMAATAKIVVQCMLLLAAVQLLRGRKWAQQLLLIFWMIVLAETFILLLGAGLWGQGEWWNDLVGWPVAAVAGPMLACSAIAATLLVLASRAGCRVRYASMVIVSVVVALLAAVAVNMIAQDSGSYIRSDVGTLERYGISDRTRKILASLDQDSKLTLTCVYTSEKEDSRADRYRPRVWELIREIQGALEQAGKPVEVVNVTTVGQKARLDARLRGKQLAGQSAHVKVLEDFLSMSKMLSADLNAQQRLWAAMPADSYLAMWGVTANVAAICRKRSEAIDQLAATVRPQLTGSGLPDCAKLVADLKVALKGVKDALAGAVGDVELIRSIPPAAAKRRVAVRQALDDAARAADAVLKTLAAAKAAPAADPAKVLAAFTVSARQAADRIRKAADLLANLAGADKSRVILGSRPFSHDQEVMTAFGAASVRSNLVRVLKDYVAKPLDDMAGQADALVKNAKSSFQAEAVGQFRKAAASSVELLSRMRTKAAAAVAALSKVDKPTQGVFDSAKEGKLFAAVTKPISALLDRIGKLPEIKSSSLTKDVAEENIVIIEVGDETRVATFDQVWPRRGGRPSPMAPPEKVNRTFNGDSAIGSKILAMSHKPFATVLLTYYQQQVPPRTRRRMPRPPSGPMPPAALQTLRTALTDARFEVKEWNLAANGQKPEIDSGTSKILIVLPAPPKSPMAMFGRAPQTPSFGQPEMDRIRAEIDSGTPAIFMAMYLDEMMPTPYGMPMPMPRYGYMGKYLHDEWGIDVRHKYRLVKGIADRDNPGQYKIDALAFTHMPISTFTDQPIGAPLRGQRVFWLNACPVAVADKLPAGVDVQPVLEVRARASGVWATKNLAALIRKVTSDRGGLVSPGPGDIRGPMTLALAATRAEEQAKKRSGTRIVVLGVGMSMIDGYVNQEVPVLNETGFSVEPPPRANTDLVVNSLYWLSGREQFIAAGPARLKPIAAIGDGEMVALRILCMGVLPVVILLVGGAVHYARRH